MTLSHDRAHLKHTDEQLRKVAITAPLDEWNKKAGKNAPKKEARFARLWYIGFWFF